MAKLLSGTRIYGTATVDTQLFVSGSNAASSTITGALQVVGGLGVGLGGYFGGNVTATNFIGNLTGIATTASLATTATNIAGGGVGSLPYQTGAGATTMLSLGTNGYVLTAGATAPQWTAISGLSAGLATTATNLAGGTAGQLAYQSSPGVTLFAGPGTSGQLLMSSGTNAPQYISTASINVGRSDLSITATNVAGGAGGSLVYQSAAGVTAMLNIATTAGYVLSSTGSLPQWASLNSLGAGSATTATHIAGGTAGQVPYQTAPGLTSFFGPGTAGQVLVSNGTSAPSYSSNLSLTTITATTFVGNLTGTASLATTATNADSVKTLGQASNATYYPTFVDANNTTLTSESVYTTSSFVINPNTGYIGMGTATPGRPLHVVTIGTATQGIAAFEASASGLVIQDNSGKNGDVEIAGYRQSGATYHNIVIRADVLGLYIQKTTGNVGVGTTATLAKFVVNGGTVNSTTYTSSEARIADGTLHLMKTSAGGVFEALRAINNDTTAGTTVRLLAAATSDPFNNANGGKVFIDAIRTASNMDLVFSLNDVSGAAAVERVRILGTGAIAFNGSTNYGTAGQILQSNGNAPPTWVASSGVGAGSATTASNVAITNDSATITPQYITFVSTSTGSTGIKTNAVTGLNYIPSSGYVGIGINPPTAPLHIVSSVSTIIRFRGASTGQVGNLVSDATQILLASSSNAEAYGILPSTNALVMKTNATDRITVDLNGQVKVLANIESTAVSTGSLVVTGGVGISSNLYVGGLINGGNGARITGTVTATTFVGNLTGNASGTAGALAGGAVGSLPYQSGVGATSFLAIGTAGYFLTVNSGATAPQWTQTLGVANGGTGVNTLTGVVYGNGTSAFTAATGPQISTALGTTNISGSAANVTGTVLTSNGGTGLTSWTAGDIPYYASGTALSKLAIGVSGYVLTSSGSAPQWSLASGLSAGSAATASNIAGGAANQIPYQSGVSSTAFSNNLTWTNSSNTFGVTGTISATGSLTRGGAVSSSAWSTTSPVLHNAGTVLTDTSSGAGTVSARVGVSLHSPNFAASNAITITDAVNLYLQAPVASTNVTITNNWGLYNQGNTYLNGNVGIGRTTTGAKVDIFQENSFNATTPGTTTGYGIHLSGQATADYATGITFSAGNASAGNANAGIYTQGSGAYGTKMYLATTDSYATGAKTRLMIDHVGNVGIGTISPAAKLHVFNSTPSGVTSAPGGTDLLIDSSTNSYLTFRQTADAGLYGGIQWVDNNAGAYIVFRNYTASGTTVGSDSLIYGSYQDHIFQTGTSSTVNGKTEVLRITQAGNVGIGTNSPTNKFEISGTAGQLFSVSNSFTGTIFSANDASGIPSIEVLDTGLVKLAQYNGQVAINTGTIVTGSALSVNGIISTMGSTGEIRASSEITAYYSSDARLKENVTVIADPIEMLSQIRGVYFDWTDEHIRERGGEDGVFVRKHDVGVIAQEVEAILPEIVTTRENGYKAVRYEKIVPLLIEAIKSQQSDIDILKAEIENLKKFIK